MSPTLGDAILDITDDCASGSGLQSPWSPPGIDGNLLSARHECGTTLGDLSRSPQLSARLREFHLRDYFDQQGIRRFRNLSLSFAAKQNPQITSTFGSTSENKEKAVAKSNALSARAYRLATEVLDRDKQREASENKNNYDGLGASERFRNTDVRQRQHEMLFLEVPSWRQYLPPGIALESLMPLEISKDEEREERRKDEKMNASLGVDTDVKLHKGAEQWLLTHAEIQDVLQSLSTWTTATRTAANSVGVDRGTYCRYILDCGLVDQVRVPYFWAVSLFDCHAKPCRYWHNSEGNDAYQMPAGSVAHFVPMVNKWNFLLILDTLLRQHFDDTTKQKFISSLHQVVLQKSPMLKSALAGKQLKGAQDDHEAPGLQNVRGSLAMLQPIPQGQTMVQNARPAEGSDLKDTITRRDRLVSAMLIEPEVIKLSEQYKEIFVRLHSCYCDHKQHVSFANFLQFCHDFRFVPRIASTYALQLAYASAECIEINEIREKKKVNRNTSSPHGRPSVRSPTEGQRHSRPRKTIGANSIKLAGTGLPPVPGLSAPPAELDTPRQMRSSNMKIQRKASKELVLNVEPSKPPLDPEAFDSAEPLSPTMPLSDEAHRRRSRKVSGEKKKSTGGTRRSVAITGVGHPEEDTPTVQEDEYVEVVRKESCFGLSAFTETLCKSAFVYLASYGNDVQRGTSSRGKMMWLITYLHCVTDHLLNSRAKRTPKHGHAFASEDSPRAAESKRLDAALKQIDLKFFTDSPEVEIMQNPEVSKLPSLPGNGIVKRSTLPAMGESQPNEEEELEKGSSSGRRDKAPTSRSNSQLSNVAGAGDRLSSKDSTSQRPESQNSLMSGTSGNTANSERVVPRGQRRKKRNRNTVGEESFDDGNSLLNSLGPVGGIKEDRLEPPMDLMKFENMIFRRLLERPQIGDVESTDDGRDLNGKFAHLDASRLTPPPLGQFALELNDRLQAMISKKASQL
jgi:hypothetical protein